MVVLHVTFTHDYYPTTLIGLLAKGACSTMTLQGFVCSGSARFFCEKMCEGARECVDLACGSLAACMSGASFQAFFLSSFLTLGACSELCGALIVSGRA